MATRPGFSLVGQKMADLARRGGVRAYVALPLAWSHGPDEPLPSRPEDDDKGIRVRRSSWRRPELPTLYSLKAPPSIQYDDTLITLL